MEKKTTFSKGGLIKAMVILQVYYRNSFFHVAEPKTVLGD